MAFVTPMINCTAARAPEWDAELGLCIISCPTDINIDGATAIGDLLLLLASFASLCSGTE